MDGSRQGLERHFTLSHCQAAFSTLLMKCLPIRQFGPNLTKQ